MRLKHLTQDMTTTIVGVSKNKEKAFKRAVVCIQEKDKIYKIISCSSSKKDGSISLFFNYCKEKKAFVVRHKHKYRGGIQYIGKSQITDEFSIEFDVDKNAKISIHKTGFVQLSGKGVKSGIDEVTGRPKGVGVFSSPLDNPVSSGPTFGISCWGISHGFELLEKQKPGVQYIILSKENSDFTERDDGTGKDMSCYVLEFFIFPKEANKSIYEYKDRLYIKHRMDNYLHEPGAIFSHPVLDLSFFDGVLCVFPVIFWTGFTKRGKCGYSIGSPGGADSLLDKSGSVYIFHIFCPANEAFSLLGEDQIKSLEYRTRDSNINEGDIRV